MAYTRPLRRKTAQETAEGLDSIFSEFPWIPKFFYSDKGNEFNKSNAHIKEIMKTKFRMHMYNMTGPTKNPIVERWNRTFSNDLMRYFTAKKIENKRSSYKWVDVLSSITNNINNRVNRSIGMKPAEVKEKHVAVIRERLYGDNKPVKCRHNIGDIIRIPLAKNIFEKGYTQSKDSWVTLILISDWSTECYTVQAVHQSFGICYYKIKDSDGKILERTFYNEELNLVASNNGKRND